MISVHYTVADSVRRRPLVYFFVFAYAISWGLWLPVNLFGIPAIDETLSLPSIYILPGVLFGATGSALLTTAIIDGKAGVIALLKRFLLWKVGLRWYAFAILGLPVVMVVIGFLLSGDSRVSLFFSPASLALYPAAYFSHFYFGPLCEEAAWRGFALPRLQVLHGPLKGTLILGILWGVWHLPVYLPLDSSFIFFLVSTLGMTIVFTWLFNNTKGSLLLAILLHGCIDGTVTYVYLLAAKDIIPLSVAGDLELGLMLSALGVAIVLLFATRGRLSYDTYRRSGEYLAFPKNK